MQPPNNPPGGRPPYGQAPQHVWSQAPAPHGPSPQAQVPAPHGPSHGQAYPQGQVYAPPGYPQPRAYPHAYPPPPAHPPVHSPGSFHGRPEFPAHPAHLAHSQAHSRPVLEVGLFGNLPCPHCGAPTQSNAGEGAHVARWAGGLIGWLIASAFMTKYHCPTHGVIPHDQFPGAHQDAIVWRKVAKIGGAVAVFVFVIAIFFMIALLR
ncbi:MAG: hypothetical protein U0414_38310 [Polyangiaceae bacterium]